MMKKILVFAVAGMALAACSNEEEGLTAQQGATNSAAVYFTPENAETRGSMTAGLLNTWNYGDVVGVFSQYEASGSMTNNGAQNATFTFTPSYNSYTNVFVQSTSETSVAWQDATSKHNFYLYFPRTDAATSASAVPFNLSNRQTQDTKDEWNTTNGQYNFMWKVIKGATRPYDQTIPFSLNRMLPVAQFTIVRDASALDGYKLTQVELKPTTGTMAMGNTTVDLTNAGSISSLSFGSTTDSYVVYANNGFAVNSVEMYKSFNIYMSVPPAAAREYTATATFTNGSDTKIVEVTRTDAFTIANGKGNLVNYYFNASTKEDGSGDDEGGNGNVGYRYDFGDFIMAEANLVYINNTFRFANSLTECQPDATLSGVTGWSVAGSKYCYWQYGTLPVTDGTTVFNNNKTYTIGNQSWPNSSDPCRQVAGGQWYVPTSTQINTIGTWLYNNGVMQTVQQNGHTYEGMLVGVKNSDGTLPVGAVWMPAAGERQASNYGQLTYLNGSASTDVCGAYWSSTPYNHSYGPRSYYMAFDKSVQKYSLMDSGSQTCGLSIRCVRNK